MLVQLKERIFCDSSKRKGISDENFEFFVNKFKNCNSVTMGYWLLGYNEAIFFHLLKLWIKKIYYKHGVDMLEYEVSSTS